MDPISNLLVVSPANSSTNINKINHLSLLPGQQATVETAATTMDLEQSLSLSSSSSTCSSSSSLSPSFNYDPFDGFSFLDQQGMRFYDCLSGGFGGSSGVGPGCGSLNGRNSPLSSMSNYGYSLGNALDQFDPLQHHQSLNHINTVGCNGNKSTSSASNQNFLYQTDPSHQTIPSHCGAIRSTTAQGAGAGAGSGIVSATTTSISPLSTASMSNHLNNNHATLCQEDDDQIIHETLANFANDLGIGISCIDSSSYNSSADLFSSSSIMGGDGSCSDSGLDSAYHLRLSVDQSGPLSGVSSDINNLSSNNLSEFVLNGSSIGPAGCFFSSSNGQDHGINHHHNQHQNQSNHQHQLLIQQKADGGVISKSSSSLSSQGSSGANFHSDIDTNNNNNYNCIYDTGHVRNDFNNSYNNSCNGDSNTSQATKRSVLMNLLIDGSDVGAGYTSYNCRALPQKLEQHISQHHHHHHCQSRP